MHILAPAIPTALRSLAGCCSALLCAALAPALTGCGGASGTSAGAAAAVSPALAEATAQPTFHLAPLILEEPSDIDADGSGNSAGLAPHTQAIPQAMLVLDSARLTPQMIAQRLSNAHPGIEQNAPLAGSASATTLTVFTPAQIRAAYQLPPLPAANTKLTTVQAASLGAGQTIYLIDAYDDPTAATDLATFSAKFGLPGCATASIAPGTSLPLPAASSAAGCTFAVAYVGANGQLQTAAPSYEAGWATEIALDVQWAHATAPLARIVLLETQSAAVSQLSAAIQLANRMGPGIVSMSFGASEGSWVASYDAIFAGAGNGYVASTGDWGTGVCWPSVSPSVLAVGGTTLSYSGTGSRSETAWSNTGGGLSAFVAEPSYQGVVVVPGDSKIASSPHAMRGVADVSFNADPNTGQYLVVTSPGAKTANWYSAGGTSIGSPQWAGLLAVANAQRALQGKAPVNLLQIPLYERVATVKGLYAGAFLDVTVGADGSCATCRAGVGYDLPTGLGTPNAGNLLGQLAAF